MEQIVSLASTLDSQKKADATITVAASRATLRGVFPPKKRGGPLYYHDHRIDLVPRPPRDPNTAEMFNGDGTPTQEARA